NQLEERDVTLKELKRSLDEREGSIDKRIASIDDELQRIGRLTKDQARELYLKQLEVEFQESGTRRAKEIEARAVVEADRKAKALVLDVIQRAIVDYVTEATLAVVELPSED